MTLNDDFTGNYSLVISWSDESAAYYKVTYGAVTTGNIYYFIDFCLLNLNNNTAYNITVKAYDSEDNEIGTVSDTYTTNNGILNDDLSSYLKFTTDIQTAEVSGDEFEHTDEDHNNLYSNCNISNIYYTMDTTLPDSEDIYKQYDPGKNDTGKTRLYDANNPLIFIMTEPDDWNPEPEVEDEITFPYNIRLWFRLAFGYLDDETFTPTETTSNRCLVEADGMSSLDPGIAPKTASGEDYIPPA